MEKEAPEEQNHNPAKGEPLTQNGDSRVVPEGSHVDSYEDDPNTKCGFGSFHPHCLQVFARIGAFVGIYSISGLLTSSLSVYVNSQVSMLEKQFGFSSAETGVLMSCNDIGYLTFALFCGYFASKVHIPRVLGLSTILFGVCGIMCALPYFLQDTSTYESDPMTSNATVPGSRRKVPMCDVTNASLTEFGCAISDSQEAVSNLEELRIKRVAYWLIAIGMVFQGVGKSVRNPFVTLYIDDAVDKRKTGFYMGIIIGTAIFGPALAYLLGGVFSKIYVTLQSVEITPTDPRWIGAWWLGFLGFGGCAILFSVPIMCFPRKMRSRRRRQDELGECVSRKVEDNNQSLLKSIFVESKGFILAMLRVLKNPVYTTIALSNSINLLGVSGILAFMPKYISSQYSIPLWKANIILALSSITAVSIGTFFGGLLTRRIKMTPLTTCKLLVLFFFGNILCQMTGFVLGCDQPILYGDNSVSTHPDLYRPTNSMCLQGCSCSDDKYFPICGEDGRDYFSPCHGGCTDKKGAMGFVNCTCIPGGYARAGLCDQGCSTNLYIYAAFTFIGKFITALKIIPAFIAGIRCVDESDRGVSTATSSFLTSTIVYEKILSFAAMTYFVSHVIYYYVTLFTTVILSKQVLVKSWMPGPVIFGLVIDNTCLLWKYTCGQRQSCQLYDIHYFRKAIHAYGTIASTIGMLLIIGLYFYFRVKGVQTWRSNSAVTRKILPGENLDKEMMTMKADEKVVKN